MLRPFDASHLERFWDLASLDEQKRRTAARDIVDQLAAEQAGDQRDEKVAYTLKRLVRGLQSSRDGARQGYSLALTELLCTYEDITTARVLQMVEETMVTSSSMKGQEERDVYFGRIFACMALIRCERLLLSDSVQVAKLLGSAAEKTFLREVCAELLGELASQRSFAEFEADLMPVISAFIGDSISVDAVSLVARLRLCFPSKRPATKCPKIWNKQPLVHPINLAAITSALKNSTGNHPHIHTVWTYLSDLDGDKALYLPALWRDVVENELLTSTHERRYLAFELFCRLAPQVVGMDTGNADGWSGLLKRLLSPNFVRCLANNLSQPSNYLYEAAKKCTATIHKMARVDGGVHRLEIVKALLLGDLNFDRLSNTKVVTQEVNRLPADAMASYRRFIVSVFDGEHVPLGKGSGADDLAEKGTADSGSSSSEEAEDEAGVQVERQQLWAIGQVYGLAKTPNADENIQLSSLLFLHTYGFYRLPLNFTAHKVLGAMGARKICTCSAAVRSLCQQRFYSLLQHLSSRVVRRLSAADSEQVSASNKIESEGGHVEGLTSDGKFWATHAVMHGQELLQCAEVELLNPVPDDAASASCGAINALTTLQTRIHAERDIELSRRLRGVEYILVNVLLLQLSEPTNTVELLNDIAECSVRIGQTTQSEVGGEEDLDPISVLVDCMLSLLTRPSALVRLSPMLELIHHLKLLFEQTREVVRTVFRSFTADLHEAAFDLLVHALTATVTEDDEEAESDDEDVDELPEIELGSEDDDEDEDEDKNETDDEDEDGNEEEEEQGVQERQKQKLEDEEANNIVGAVQRAPFDSDEDMYDEEHEEADLDDDEMFKQGFNEKLAQILRLSQENRKKSQEDKRRASAHWKLRVLDLVEIFIKRQPRSGLLLGLPGPLLQCIQASNIYKEEAAASERCSGVLLKLSRSKEVPLCDSPKVAKQVDNTMAEIIEGLFHTPVPVKIAVASIGYLIRVRDTNGTQSTADTTCNIVGAEAAVMPLLRKAYLQSLERRSCRLQPKFFVELVQRRPTKWITDAMLQQMVPATASAGVASPYLRAESTAFLQRLINMQLSAASQTAALLQALTDVLIDSLQSATKTDLTTGAARLLPQRAKQALAFGQAVLVFARRLPDAERTQPSLTAKWVANGATKNVETALESMFQTFDQVPSVRSQCERMLTTIGSIWGSQDAQVKDRPHKRKKR